MSQVNVYIINVLVCVYVNDKESSEISRHKVKAQEVAFFQSGESLARD